MIWTIWGVITVCHSKKTYYHLPNFLKYVFSVNSDNRFQDSTMGYCDIPHICVTWNAFRCLQDTDVIPDETGNTPPCTSPSPSKQELFLAKVSDIDTSLHEYYTPWKLTNVFWKSLVGRWFISFWTGPFFRGRHSFIFGGGGGAAYFSQLQVFGVWKDWNSNWYSLEV